MPQEFAPTLNEDKLVGGIQNFGAIKFTPTISNLTGDYYLRGHLQRIGRIVHFGILIEGKGGGLSFTLTGSVLTLPSVPFRRTIQAAANTTVFQGICFQNGAALTTIAQNSAGTFNLVNETRTNANTWIYGQYWVE